MPWENPMAGRGNILLVWNSGRQEKMRVLRVQGGRWERFMRGEGPVADCRHHQRGCEQHRKGPLLRVGNKFSGVGSTRDDASLGRASLTEGMSSSRLCRLWGDAMVSLPRCRPRSRPTCGSGRWPGRRSDSFGRPTGAPVALGGPGARTRRGFIRALVRFLSVSIEMGMSTNKFLGSCKSACCCEALWRDRDLDAPARVSFSQPDCHPCPPPWGTQCLCCVCGAGRLLTTWDISTVRRKARG